MRPFEKLPFHLPDGVGRSGPLILALLAVAAAVGACGGGGSDEKAEQVIREFLEVGQNPGAKTEVMVGKLPPDLPPGLPRYPGASTIGSAVATEAERKGYSVVDQTADPLDNVLLFFEDALEQPPWQIVFSTSQEGFAGLQFGSQDDPNFIGSVIIQNSNDQKRRSILLSAQVVEEEASPQPFELGAGKPLPRGFPSEMPLYPDMTVTDTAWGRSGDTTSFEVKFLTESLPQDVIAFYRNDLQSRGGWSLTEKPIQGTAVGFSFAHNAEGQTWNGDIDADLFAKDSTYTQGSVRLRIGPEINPTPTASPP